MANGVIIGKSGIYEYRTWASLRTAFSQANPGLLFSVEYPAMVPGTVSLKSAADGSGLIRADFHLTNLGSGLQFHIGSTNPQPNPSPPPPFVADFYLQLDWYDYVANSTVVPIELQTELIGETVTKSAGMTVTITSDLFTATGGQQFFLYGTGIDQGYVTDVGKLTPIT